MVCASLVNSHGSHERFGELCHTTQDAKKRRKQNRRFLDALTSFDFKLSVSQSVTYRFFTANAYTGLSDFFRHLVAGLS